MKQKIEAQHVRGEGEMKIECTADQDHPCDGGGRDDNDCAIPCPACVEWHAEIEREARAEWNAGLGRSKAAVDAELRDAGREHLVRP